VQFVDDNYTRLDFINKKVKHVKLCLVPAMKLKEESDAALKDMFKLVQLYSLNEEFAPILIR